MPSPASPLRHHHRVTVMVAGQRIEALTLRHDYGRHQDTLREAKTRFGKALCMCQDSGPLPLVIRERAGKLFLAAWPDQADAHAVDCPFYSAEAESAKSAYVPGAITDDGTQVIIRLHHPVIHDSQSNRARTRGNEALHIWGLVHHLWDESGLNRWHPGWTRDWGRVRSCIRRVAQTTVLDGEHVLLRSLYVPPIWSPSRKDDIARTWADFKAPLLRQHRASSQVASGFVVGVVRELQTTEIGYALRLQHHAERIFLDHKTADFLAGYSRRGWAALKVPQTDDGTSRATVIAALRVQATRQGSLVVVEGALMRVSKDYIPVTSSYEQRVAEALVQQQRRFIKPLHFDMHRRVLPHFILTDCANPQSDEHVPVRMCMYVYGANVDDQHLRKLQIENAADARERGCDVWFWHAAASDSPPPFPTQASSLVTSHPRSDHKEHSA